MAGKLACLILVFYFVSLTGYAQKNLKEARAVFNNADTVSGYIDYKEWFGNPSFILFTAGKGAATKRFDVSEVSYFEMIGLEQYKRYTVQVSLDNPSASGFGGKDSSSETRTVFLKLVQRGKNVTLLSYTDKLKTRLYILDKDETTPKELQNSTYLLNGQLTEERQYRTMLLNAVSKYQPGDGILIEQLNTPGYYFDIIEKVCLKLNGIDKALVTRSAKSHSKPKWRLFIGGGINHGALTMSGGNMFTGINSHPFYAPVATAGADIALNPAVGKIIFRLQFQATSYKTDGYLFNDYSQYTDQYFFKFRQTNFALEPQFIYNLYNKKNLKWFVSAGAGFNFSSYPVNELKFLRTSSTNAEAQDENYLKYLRNVWLNGCFSTGIDLSRLELSFLYFTPGSITQTGGYGLDNSSLQLRVAYFIKK